MAVGGELGGGIMVGREFPSCQGRGKGSDG